MASLIYFILRFIFFIYLNFFTNLDVKLMGGRYFELIFEFKTIWTYHFPYIICLGKVLFFEKMMAKSINSIFFNEDELYYRKWYNSLSEN
jgi:hypothetical protein